MKRLLILPVLILSLVARTLATDTVYVTPSSINTKVLMPGTHRWLVYFKMGEDSPRTMFSIWSRTITPLQYEGRNAIAVTQAWEDKDSIMHTTRTICDARDFSNLYHESWWKQRGTTMFNFLKGTMEINNKPVQAGDTSKAVRQMRQAFDSALVQYHLNWHLDLEVFPLLPHRKNTTFMIKYYDPGSQQPKWVPYTITGSALLEGTEKQMIDCWIMEHQSPNNKEVFWISKRTKEVLKLEQQFGKRYRYKIKLPFSK